MIDKKIKKINNRSTLDRENFILKLIKIKYFLKVEQSIRYFTSKKDSEYIHRELKKHDEINDACEFLKKFKNTNNVHEFYKKITEMNMI